MSDDPATQALVQLSKRKDPEAVSWWMMYAQSQYEFGIKPNIQCLLCDQMIWADDMYLHGAQHLKEHNLLPFI